MTIAILLEVIAEKCKLRLLKPKPDKKIPPPPTEKGRGRKNDELQ
jgi:hypothetical protein